MSRSLAARITPPSSIGISYCFPVRLSVTVSVSFAIGVFPSVWNSSLRSAVSPDRRSKTSPRINIYTVRSTSFPRSEHDAAIGGMLRALCCWRSALVRVAPCSTHELRLWFSFAPASARHRVQHDDRSADDFGLRVHRRDHLRDGLRRDRAADGDRERLRAAALGSHDAVFGLPGVDRPLRSQPGRDRGGGRMPARIVRRLLRRRERRAMDAAEVRALHFDRAARNRTRRSLFRPLGLARRIHQPSAAGGPHLHRVARRSRADAPGAVHDLYAARLVHLVFRAGVGRDEARTALGPSRPVFSSLRRRDRGAAGRGRRRGAVQSD